MLLYWEPLVLIISRHKSWAMQYNQSTRDTRTQWRRGPCRQPRRSMNQLQRVEGLLKNTVTIAINFVLFKSKVRVIL